MKILILALSMISFSALAANNSSMKCEMIRNGEVVDVNYAGVVDYGVSIESGRPFLTQIERNSIDLEGQQYGSYMKTISDFNVGIVGFEVSILKMNDLWSYYGATVLKKGTASVKDKSFLLSAIDGDVELSMNCSITK